MRNPILSLLFSGIYLVGIMGCNITVPKDLSAHGNPPTCAKITQSGSGSDRAIRGEPPLPLRGSWQTRIYYRDGIPTDFPYQETIQFGQSDFYGFDGCNQLWGEYVWDGMRGDICPLQITAMRCERVTQIEVVNEQGEVTIIGAERRDRYEAYSSFVEGVYFEEVEGELWFYLNEEKSEVLRFKRE